MALPILERAYSFDVNNVIPPTGNDDTERKTILLNIYNKVQAWGSNAWTMVASSDKSTAGWPGPGWQTISDIDNGTTTRSWVVFETANGSQIGLDYNGVNDDIGSIRFAPFGGLSGGSISAFPSGSYRTVKNSQTWWNDYPSGQNILHMIHADNGEFDLFVTTRSGFTQDCLFFSKVSNPVPNYTHPWVMGTSTGGCSDTANCAMLGYRSGTGWYDGFGFAGSQTSSTNLWDGRLGTEVFESAMMPNKIVVANEIDNAWGMYPVAMCGETGPDQGVHGRLADIFAVSTALNTGDTLEANPASPTMQWCVFGNFAVPWNGTTPIVV